MDDVIVVERVECEGTLVTVDPPARFVPLHTPRGWMVAANEFLLTPRAATRAALQAAAESAIWNLAVVLSAIDEPEVRVGAPADLLARAATLRERLHMVDSASQG